MSEIDRAEAGRRAGPLRRVGYSVLGLLVGIVVLYFINLAWAIVELRPQARPLPAHWASPSVMVYYVPFAVAGWIVFGLPFALAVPSRSLTRLRPLPGFLLDAAVGPLAMLMVFTLWGLRTHGDFEIARMWLAYIFAAAVAAPAMYVYTRLLKSYAGI